MTGLKKILKQASFLLGSNVFASILNFLTMMLLAKYLTAQDLGRYVVLQAYILFLAALFNTQAWQGFIKYIAHDINKIRAILFHTLWYDISIALVGFLSAIVLAPFYIKFMGLDESYTPLLQFLSFYILINQTSTSIGLLRYFEKFKFLALQNIIASISLILGVFLGCLFSASVTFFVFWSVFSLMLGVISINIQALILYLRKKDLFAKTESQHSSIPKGLFRFNLYAYFTNIVDLPIKQLDTILVGSLVNVEASGVFKIIKQIGTLTTKLTGPINQVLYPELNKNLAGHDYVKVKYILIRFTFIIASIVLPVSILLGQTSGLWLGVLFKDYFIKYQFELSFYLFIHAFSISFLAVHPIFLALGYVKNLFYLTIISNILFVLFSLVLTPIYGLFGVIISIAIQYAITIIIKIIPVMLNLNKNILKLQQ